MNTRVRLRALCRNFLLASSIYRLYTILRNTCTFILYTERTWWLEQIACLFIVNAFDRLIRRKCRQQERDWLIKWTNATLNIHMYIYHEYLILSTVQPRIATHSDRHFCETCPSSKHGLLPNSDQLSRKCLERIYRNSDKTKVCTV